uniref:rRNA-processing protein FCF1 n=2 Tax=Lygus hesperus TaxID=30085 RepID=A0A146MBE4_LYGHE
MGQKSKHKAKSARMLKKTDDRLKTVVPAWYKHKLVVDPKRKKEAERILGSKQSTSFEGQSVQHIEQANPALFFRYNTALGPPYRIILDTNFINFSIQNKLDIFTSLMDCLLAKCIPIITDCVLGELEKLGPRYQIARKIVKDPRFERYTCTHKGTYADDCIVRRVQQHKCFIVATCDKD